MQPNKLREAKTRVAVHLTSVIVVLVVAIFFAACANNSNQNSNVPKTVTMPTPTPSPSGTPGPDQRGDTIIVIRDGSVDIQINSSVCEKKTGGHAHEIYYECNGIELDDIAIMNKKGHEPKRCPKAHKNSKVTINRGDKEIEVMGTSNRNDKKVTIKFNDTDYPQCAGTGHYCNTTGEVHIRRVKVDSLEQECVLDDECEIWVWKAASPNK